MSTLRPLENFILWPSETPNTSFPSLECLRPRPGEFWAVLDPPRERTRGGIILRSDGDGWGNESIESIEKLGEDWDRLCDAALRAIVISKADPKSFTAKKRAFYLSEMAQGAYQRLQRALKAKDGESPGAGMELRSDGYTVVAAHKGVPFVKGDRIMAAPYSPRRLKSLFGVNDVCLFGREDPWEDVVPFVWNPLKSEWELTSNWVGVRLDQRGYSVETLQPKYLNSGRVFMAGPDAQSKPGETVVLHRDRTVPRPDDTKWFVCMFSDFDPRGRVFVRERDSDGVQRVLASLG